MQVKQQNTDTDTDSLSPMTDCIGGKYDPNSDLCWQNPPRESDMNWYQATGVYDADDNPTTINYCSTLGSRIVGFDDKFDPLGTYRYFVVETLCVRCVHDGP